MSNYMENVAEMLGVKLHEGFYVVHNNGRSLVVLEEEGIRFINHIGCLKEDAPAICLQEILNGNFRIEHINETSLKTNIPNVILIEGCDEELFINGKSVCIHDRLYPSDVLNALAENGVINFERKEC